MNFVDGWLWIRVDADREIGIGHVMRCLALAQVWRDAGGKVEFFCRDMLPMIREWLLEEGCHLTIFKQTGAIAEISELTERYCAIPHTERPAWIVLDGYKFDTEYQSNLRNIGLLTCVIDDYAHLPEYQADLLVNQNPASDRLNYPINTDCKVLSGTHYAMLRREYRIKTEFLSDGDKQILVLMGGSDRNNYTTLVLKALSHVNDPDLLIKVVLGPGFQYHDLVETFVKTAHHRVEILSGIRNLKPYFAQSELAIVAAGSVCWELASLARPMIVMTTAENQNIVAAGLIENDAAINLGEARLMTEKMLAGVIQHAIRDNPLREKLGENARKMIDGKGAERVVQTMLEIEQAVE